MKILYILVSCMISNASLGSGFVTFPNDFQGFGSEDISENKRTTARSYWGFRFIFRNAAEDTDGSKDATDDNWYDYDSTTDWCDCEKDWYYFDSVTGTYRKCYAVHNEEIDREKKTSIYLEQKKKIQINKLASSKGKVIQGDEQGKEQREEEMDRQNNDPTTVEPSLDDEKAEEHVELSLDEDQGKEPSEEDDKLSLDEDQSKEQSEEKYDWYYYGSSTVESTLDDEKGKDQSELSLDEDQGKEQSENKNVNISTDFFWIGVGVGGSAVVIVGVMVFIYCKKNRNTKNGNTEVTHKFKEAHEHIDENLYSSTHQKRTAEPHIYAVTTTNSDYVILC